MYKEHERIEHMIANRTGKIFRNPSRSMMIDNAVMHWNTIRLESGTLVTWTPRDSTGRSPNDTLIVRRPESEANIDWCSPYAIGVSPEAFEMIYEDVMVALELKDRLYVLDRGYFHYGLYQAILDADSSFVCRARDNVVLREIVEERELTVILMADASLSMDFGLSAVDYNLGKATERVEDTKREMAAQIAAAIAGASATSTCTMIFEMVSPPRICGELLTTKRLGSGRRMVDVSSDKVKALLN